MKGSMCPTCIEGAVGSIPTYIPARFSVKTLCNKSRSLRSLTVSTPFKCCSISSPKQCIVNRCNLPDNIMNQASLLQVLREVLPCPCLDFPGEPSPFLLSIFHPLDILLRNPSLLLEACPRLRDRQYRPIVITAQRKCRCCGKTARSARDVTGVEKIPAWRSAERCRMWSHWTGFRM